MKTLLNYLEPGIDIFFGISVKQMVSDKTYLDFSLFSLVFR